MAKLVRFYTPSSIKPAILLSVKEYVRPVRKQAKEGLQEFIGYSVQHYDGMGRLLSQALKSPFPPKAKK